MNREWMLQRLETFRKVIEAYQAEARRSADYNEKQRSLNEEATYQIPTVREILKPLELDDMWGTLVWLVMTRVGRLLHADPHGRRRQRLRTRRRQHRSWRSLSR